MTPGARAWVLLVALLTAALAALTPSAPPPAGAPPAAAAPRPTAGSQSPPPRAGLPLPAGEPFAVRVDTLSPVAPGPEDTLLVTGRVLAGEPLADVVAQLRVGPALTSRSALARADARLLTTAARGEPLPVADDVPAGETRPFRVVVPAADLRLRGPGVHPVQVEVRARVAPAAGDAPPGGTTVRTVQTVVPALPDPVEPSRLAVVVPLAHPPAAGAAPSLSASLAPGGRLHGLVEAGAAASARGVPPTWAVDPALLGLARGLAEGGDAVAAAWLARAREVLRGGPVLALPYADADVVALAGAGDGLRDEARFADDAGRALVAEVLGVAPEPGWAWPPDGLLTPAALELLAETGTERLLLEPAAVARAGGSAVTDDARVRLAPGDGDPLDALLTDPGLSALAAAGAAGPAERPTGAVGLGTGLAVQRLAAETALLTAERPTSGRRVVLAPPRQWDVTPDYARALLTGLAEQPWVRVQPLPALLPDEPAAVPEPDPDDAVLAAEGVRRAAELALGPAFLDPLAAARRELDELGAALTRPEPVLTPARLALLRGASAVWRDPELQVLGLSVAADAVRTVAALRGAVRVDTSGPVLFTAETGTIPLTLVNELDQAVVVRLAVDTAGRARLLSDPGEPVEIEAGRRRQVDVRAAARGSGTFPVTVTLLSPQGVPLGPPVTVTVRSTAYGRVAVAITVAAAGVLVAAAGVRLVRRAWRTHRAVDGPTGPTA